MAQRRNRRAGSLLDALPAKLRLEASPESCTCSGCEPLMSPVERERHQATERKWHTARKAWCAEHGFSLFELMVAERIRGAPSKAQGTTPDGDRRPVNPTP